MEQELYTLLYIFFARIIDVSLGTIRIILISQGHRKLAPVLGFIEILIWLTAIGKALNNLTGIYSYFVYAGGFAAGNYVGMLLESKLSIGFQSIRIITSQKVTALPMMLKDEGFDISIVNGRGSKGGIFIIYTVARKRHVKKIINITNELEPNAFITIENVQSHRSGFVSKKKAFTVFGRGIAKKE
ncbi:MAG: DUF2179 domain-containing protein [Spirochaetes bacterium]|nr:DUF2179 domain-containing protein [Spirochaetota bacterium]